MAGENRSESGGSSVVGGIAGRYTTALFDLALESGQLDDIAADLADLEAMLAASEDFVRLVRNPLIGRDDQKKAIMALAEKAGLSDLTSKFLGVMSENRRLFVLPEIIPAYAQLLANHRGEVVASVTSAVALTDTQSSAIEGALADELQKKIRLETDVDETLLAGLVVRVGSRMIDSSLKTKLGKLRLAMKEVG